MRARYRWMVGSLVALAMSSAWAGGGRIEFSGAVLEPTCATDAIPVGPASPLSPQAAQAPRHLACGQTATDAGRTYSRTVQTIDATSAANERLLGYFASYAPAGPDGKPVAGLIVRTYD
ncbi:hypothetical protein [Rhodanobacter geophilus]|uniref:Type 1 fimbrial protein n=1 Tax=Rhodanobacter geophilus TaxID=3162488 RepID=A0ABV3QKF8_9GAMM